MKSFPPLRTLALFLTASLPLAGEIIGVETFAYQDGPLAGSDGGTFWDYANNTPTPTHTGTASAWQDVGSNPPVVGRQLVTNNSSVLRDYNGASTADGAVNDPLSSPSSDANVVYFRASVTTGDTLPTFFGISSFDFGVERVFFGKRFNQPNFGLQDLFTVTDSAVPVATNTRYTLVAKIDYVGNQISMWVDPDLNASEPAPLVAQAFPETNWSTGLRLASGGGAVSWDNVVVATSWEDLGTVVTTTDDENDGSLAGAEVSLREAVLHSPDGALITFDTGLSGQHLDVNTGEITKSSGTLTIDASELPQGVTIDAHRANRIFFLSGTADLRIEALHLTGGTTNSVGGGVFVGTTASVRLSRCTLSHHAAADGGALWVQNSATCELKACTIYGNRSTGSSGTGGLVAIADSTLRLDSCTITGNTGTGSGGGLYFQSSVPLLLHNSVLAGNTDPSFGDIARVSGTITPTGTNFIGNNSSVSATFPAGPLVGTPAAPKDPLLSAPAWFGGPTKTVHPLEDSPLIDATSSTDPGVDQRGFPHLVGGTRDIGAVEAGPVVTVTTNFDEDDGFPGGGAGVSLREAIAAADQPGHRILFSSTRFPNRIALALGQLEIPSHPGLFLDASARSGGVLLDGLSSFTGVTPTRHFDLGTGATVVLQNLSLGNGQSPDGVEDGTFDDYRGGDGGSIRSAGSLSLLSCLLFNNRGGNGGYVDLGGGILVGVGGRGGAISNGENGRLRLHDCLVEENRPGRKGGTEPLEQRVLDRGGAIFSFIDCDVELSFSTFARNRAGDGGAVSTRFARGVTVDHCTFSANEATSIGGALFLNGPQPVTVTHSTFTDNLAGSGTGGGISNSFATLTLENTINAGNLPGNLEEVGATATLLGTNLTSGDPMLAPLAIRGDGLPVHLPLPGSPAIDAATTSTAFTDQRGFPRDAAPDIGAAESQGLDDLALYWDEDWDFDGNPFGVEHSTGTDPFTFDRDDPAALAFSLNAPLFSLSNSIHPDAAPYIRVHLRRSTDLVDFSEIILTHDGPSGTNTFVAPGYIDSFSPATGELSVVGSANSPRAFFRLEAELLNP
ncbi:hypothetical protein HAHE_19840 [Haloferula helveola]|uniref:Right handed beta helix domain-containing protein n=1 Tax=Haloferula helveola TaxID=490095 RepID=A0ABN6H345_9BACT|nr:hypothetical protein HAHE_19840 [Haloferula helveola]